MASRRLLSPDLLSIDKENDSTSSSLIVNHASPLKVSQINMDLFWLKLVSKVIHIHNAN